MVRGGHIEALSDEALVRMALTDAEGTAARCAASELFGRYTRIVYRWCHRVVRDPDQALDLAQETLISAYRNLSAFRGEGRFVSWIYSITRNCCLAAQRRPSLLRDEESDPDELSSDRVLQDRALEEYEDEDRLRKLIRTHLEPREQDAIWLRCFERMPVETITQVLRIEQASGARGVLQSARRKLRAALDRRTEEDRGQRDG